MNEPGKDETLEYGVLEVRDITKRYPSVTALDQVSLSFLPGEIHALVGENGAGKSTLIKVISGSIVPDGGTIKIGNKTFSGLTPHRARELGIAAIYQETNLIPDMTVAENIFLGQIQRKRIFVNRAELEQKTKELFDSMGVSISPGTLAGGLSTAQCQMVELAKVMASRMRVLILDEPTAALTAEDVEIFFRQIRRLKEQGIAILYISHRISEIYELADRITILRDGKKILSAEVQEIDREQLIYQMVGRKLTEVYPVRNVKPQGIVLEVSHMEQGMVRDVSFQLKKGEILGIAGLTGSGRTETMQLLFGAVKKKSGEIFLNGKKVEISSPQKAVRYGLGYLPEDRKLLGLLLELSIRENISLPILKRISRGGFVRRKEEEKISRHYEETLRIKTPSLLQLVRNLSGGNQQKVVISKWLASKSGILIFDEPTQGIDAGAKYEIYQMMAQLTEQGISIIMVSSDMEELLGMSDRILVFYEGRITGELRERSQFSQEKIMKLASDLESVGNEKEKHEYELL